MGKLTTKELDKMAKDTGCSEHDDCLTCTLPECKYIIPLPKNWARDRKIVELSKSTSLEEIAELFNLHVRTIQRVLEASNG